MYGPKGKGWFSFPESSDTCFPRQSQGKHQDSRENKTNLFPEGPDIKCIVIYLDFPFNNHSKTHKQTNVVSSAGINCGIVSQSGIDQRQVNKNQPITVLVLLSESLGI